jgi:nicotinamidase/pyrazinamidase
MGLATDYCVKWTALDAVEFGFRVHLISDGCRGVNLSPRDSEQALAEMQTAGIEFVVSDTLKLMH